MPCGRGTGRGGSCTLARLSRAAAWLLALLALLGCLVPAPASALGPITVSSDQDRIELTARSEVDVYERKGDNLPVETAPSIDGSTERIVVRASTPGINPTWLVFALRNPTDKPIELWLTADRFNIVGSGVVWPDLDTRRITAVTHSTGFAPEAVRNDRVDIFRLTIERGQTVTYVAELATERVSRIYLWKPLEFEQRQRERHLFNGIMLGVMGLMAVFLTAVFAANHKLIFPAAALVSWCVLALLCVDFGFWHKLFQMRPEDNAQYRAAAEAAIAASLVIFLFTFLRVSLWHGFARILFVAWIVGQLAIVALAVLDPKLAATVARLSIAGIGGLGLLIIAFLAARRLERALALVPTWMLFLVWLFGAGATLTGRLTGEAAISGLVAGLVLIMVLIGFTVTQFAFRSNEPAYGINPSQRQLRLAAIEQAAVSVWEWSARRNEIKLDGDVEATLGLAPGELPTKVEEFVTLLHPADRERFELALQAIRQEEGGQLRMDIRLRHTDSSYRCFEIEGATVPTRDRRTLRCVGLVRDVTDAKRATERLLDNAVHDALTGLANRELLVDRTDAALLRARVERAAAPTVFFLDLDDFRAVNGRFGLIVGDSILLTVARRLQRSLGVQDTLARVGGDQFALLVIGQSDVRELARLAEQLRVALRSPIRIAGQEIVLTGSIGVAVFDGAQTDGRDLLREAEVAMYRAKRGGTDRLEIFRPELRAEKDDRKALEGELARAIGARQLTVLYQPIVALSTEELVGFEAVLRWDHPRLGVLWPADFVPVAEDGRIMTQLGAYVLGRVAVDIARWQKELARPELPLYVSVNLSSRQLLKPELVQELRHVIGRAVIQPGSLRLEISEGLVMESPEQASQVLELLQDVGVGLSIDEFGTGYSSFAYLVRFPFDTIKIDRALVQLAGQDDTAAALVRSMVAMGHELGRKVAAEGVETPEDAAFLRSIGVLHAQGFYYGDAMGEAEIERLVKLIRKADRRMRRRGLVRSQEKRKATNGQGVSQVVAGQPTAQAGLPPATGQPPPGGPVTQVSVPHSVPLSVPLPPAPSPSVPLSHPLPASAVFGAGPGGPGGSPGNSIVPQGPLRVPLQPPRPPAGPPPGDPVSRPLLPLPDAAMRNGARPPHPGSNGEAGSPPAAAAPPVPLPRPPTAPPAAMPPRAAAPPAPATPPAAVPPPAPAANAPPLASRPVQFPSGNAPPPSLATLLPADASPRATAQIAPIRAAGDGVAPAMPRRSVDPLPPLEPIDLPAILRQRPSEPPATPEVPRPQPAQAPAATVPPALAELQAALEAPQTGPRHATAAAQAEPNRSRPARRPPRTAPDKPLPASVAANLAKIAGRTAAARLGAGAQPQDAAAGTLPTVPPKSAAE